MNIFTISHQLEIKTFHKYMQTSPYKLIYELKMHLLINMHFVNSLHENLKNRELLSVL